MDAVPGETESLVAADTARPGGAPIAHQDLGARRAPGRLCARRPGADRARWQPSSRRGRSPPPPLPPSWPASRRPCSRRRPPSPRSRSLSDRRLLIRLLAETRPAVLSVARPRRSCSSTRPLRAGRGPPVGPGRRCGERGFAVRRGDTFPGLGPDWIRIAVREPATSLRLRRGARIPRPGGWAVDGAGAGRHELPAGLDLAGRQVLVCGGGPTALAPVRGLLDAQARVR